MAKAGRKSMYNAERVQKICEAISQGVTQEKAAEIGGISKTQFYKWLEDKAEFADAVKRAKAVFEEWEQRGILADAKKSLKTLICGIEYDEVKTEYEQDPMNPGVPRIKKQTTTTKRIPPNATAIIFALCNRDPEHWQNRVQQDISGKIETETKSDISLANIPDDLLAQVIEAIGKI